MAREPINEQATRNIVDHFGAKPEMLVQILQTIAMRFGWIPDDTIVQLADALNLSKADVHGVVHYYHDFRTRPPGRHIVKICQAEACQAMGSRELTEHARGTLSLDINESSDDITLEPVYCLGNCACAPAVMIDGKTHGRVDTGRFDQLVEPLRGGH